MKIYTFLGKNNNFSLIGEDLVDVTAAVRCFDGTADQVLSLDQKFIDHLRASGFKSGAASRDTEIVKVDLAEELRVIENLEKAEAENAKVYREDTGTYDEVVPPIN
jgi:hypothetical protein